MGTLLVKFGQNTTEPPVSKTLENVLDAGVASNFMAVRYGDGTVTFTKTDNIDEFQFTPDPPAEEADSGESTNDTPDQ